MAAATTQKPRRLPDLGGRTKRAGAAAIDAYETGVGVAADLHVRLADATESELLISVAGAQAQAARELATSSTAVARTLLR